MERWRIRNSILSLLAKNRAGNYIYQLLQKYFGQFNDDSFISKKILDICELIEFSLSSGVSIKGTDVLELGTGWAPLAPMMFSLYGARTVTSLDLNSYFIASLTKKTAAVLIRELEKPSRVASASLPNIFADRLSFVKKYHNDPSLLLKALNISLLSPVDARRTNFPDNSFGLYYSIDTLEHIPPDQMKLLFSESRRIIKPDGFFIHSIDTADHFSYTDNTISSINFLQFSDDEWNRLCNRYTYHNRMRKNNYETVFNDAGFTILDKIETIDPGACDALRNGFHPGPHHLTGQHDELCINRLIYILASTI